MLICLISSRPLIKLSIKTLICPNNGLNKPYCGLLFKSLLIVDVCDILVLIVFKSCINTFKRLNSKDVEPFVNAAILAETAGAGA